MAECAYCGAPADSLDHVVPFSWNHTKVRKCKAGRAGVGLKVPSCRECNVLLGNVPIHTVEGRRAYVADRLAARAPKIIDWTTEELDELGPGLRSLIEQKDAVSRQYKERIDTASR